MPPKQKTKKAIKGLIKEFEDYNKRFSQLLKEGERQIEFQRAGHQSLGRTYEEYLRMTLNHIQHAAYKQALIYKEFLNEDGLKLPESLFEYNELQIPLDRLKWTCEEWDSKAYKDSKSVKRQLKEDSDKEKAFEESYVIDEDGHFFFTDDLPDDYMVPISDSEVQRLQQLGEAK